jgi:hypothetical protein
VHRRQRGEQLARLGRAHLAEIVGGRPATLPLALEDETLGPLERRDLVVGHGDHELSTAGVAGVAALLAAQALDERGIVLDGGDGQGEPRVGVAAVGLGREDAGAGVGGAADVHAVHQQRAHARADEVIRRGGAEQATHDHDGVEACGSLSYRVTSPPAQGSSERRTLRPRP